MDFQGWQFGMEQLVDVLPLGRTTSPGPTFIWLLLVLCVGLRPCELFSVPFSCVHLVPHLGLRVSLLLWVDLAISSSCSQVSLGEWKSMWSSITPSLPPTLLCLWAIIGMAGEWGWLSTEQVILSTWLLTSSSAEVTFWYLHISHPFGKTHSHTSSLDVSLTNF